MGRKWVHGGISSCSTHRQQQHTSQHFKATSLVEGCVDCRVSCNVCVTGRPVFQGRAALAVAQRVTELVFGGSCLFLRLFE